MVQNLVWATGYNVITLPLAAGVLFNQEIFISPGIGSSFDVFEHYKSFQSIIDFV